MNFAIIGLGFVSKRHVELIYKLGHKVKYACDVSTNCGWLDFIDKNIKFTTCETEFFEWTEDCDYTVICSPNHLHFCHIMMSRSKGVICEKPLCMSIYEFDHITRTNVHFISQLRLHPQVLAFKPLKKNVVSINYTSPRGEWYFRSWKNDIKRSGGILTNIGIHLFDLLLFMFGEHYSSFVDNREYRNEEKTICGKSSFQRADACWLLSIDKKSRKGAEPKIKREFVINDEKLDLSDNNYHIQNYEKILSGSEEFKMHLARPTIALMEHLRSQPK